MHKNKQWFLPLAILCCALVIVAGVGVTYLIFSAKSEQAALTSENNLDNQNTNNGSKSGADSGEDEDQSGSNPDPQQPNIQNGTADGSTSSQQPGLVSASHIANGGVILKGSYSSHTISGVTHPAGGMILMWVGTAVSGDDSVIVPSITGMGLDWSLVKFSQKKAGAPRAMSLFKALLPASAGSGQITINFNETLPSSHWFWEIDHVSGTTIKNIYERVDGGFLTSYSMTFSPTTTAGNAAIAGMLVGNNDVELTPGNGLTKLGEGGTSFATVGSAWTTQSRGLVDFSWNKPAHCLMVGIEVAP